jgi:hypothetical protein
MLDAKMTNSPFVENAHLQSIEHTCRLPVQLHCLRAVMNSDERPKMSGHDHKGYPTAPLGTPSNFRHSRQLFESNLQVFAGCYGFTQLVLGTIHQRHQHLDLLG